jgi:hypothetical protein
MLLRLGFELLIPGNVRTARKAEATSNRGAILSLALKKVNCARVGNGKR